MTTNEIQRDALQYVVNTNGGATRGNFVEDHEPVGRQLWIDLIDHGWVYENQNSYIYLTKKGIKVLEDYI